MFLSLWNYLKGYVIVEVRGYALEKFINLMLYHHIAIWDARYKDGSLCIKTTIKGFKLLKPYAKKSRCRVRIIQKKGLPFIIFRYRKRSVLVTGALVFAIMLYALSAFIWLVDVEGNEKLQDIDVIECLEAAGYGTGKFKGNMNLRQAEQVLVNTYPEIVWAGIEFKGTKMLVQIAETVPKPVMYDEGEPCHLIAKRDALITYIATDKGMPMVKKGDTVTKGTILVSGQMQLEDEAGTLYYTHSKAKIRAKTGYTLKAIVPLVKTQKVYTNEVSKKWSIRFFNQKVSLWNQKIPYEYYDTLITINQLRLTEVFPLPFYLEREERVAYIPKVKNVDIESAKDTLLGALHGYLSAHISKDAKLVKQEVVYSKSKDRLEGVLHAIVEEDIAQVQAIDNTMLYAPKKQPVEGEN